MTSLKVREFYLKRVDYNCWNQILYFNNENPINCIISEVVILKIYFYKNIRREGGKTKLKNV